MLNHRRINFTLQLNLALAFVEGILVLWSYLREPSEPGAAVLFGFSYLRLALIAFVLFLLSIILALFWSARKSSWRTRLESSLANLVNQNAIFWIFSLLLAVAYSLFALSKGQLGDLDSYRERLLPILLWLTGLTVQLGFTVLYLRGINPAVFQERQDILRPALVIFALAGILLLIITRTRVGLTPDSIYWLEPGVPILFVQVLLAAFAGVLFYLLLEHTRRERVSRLDRILFLSLWALACIIWLSQPARLTHFSLEPTPPNYQVYPFSDSLLYDHTAREYLIGKPIPSDFWTKPLYSLFLAILHLFTGGNYAALIMLQVIFLSVIPALGYLLMVRLGMRPAGLVLAMLLILRERNALALSNVIEVSHVKLLLSDVFVMGLMVLLLGLYFQWLEQPGERRVTPLILGGVFCLIVLTRGHPILLLPFLLASVFLAPLPRFRLRWEAVALTFLGFVLPLLPWFWRNYQFTGKFTFQYPVSPYSAQMSKAYSFTPTVFDPSSLPPKSPGESDLAYYDRLQGQAAAFVLQHPDQVAKFISAHYFHNLIFSYIYLPYSFGMENAKDYVKTQPFWSNWQGNLSLPGKILLAINIGILALGFGALWKRYNYVAFVPLLFGMGYNLSVATGRLSGWRFILPADWITLVYYSMGVIELYSLLRLLTNQGTGLISNENKPEFTVHPLRGYSLTGFALLFLILSLALTQGQALFSYRYPARSAAQLKEDYSEISSQTTSSISASDVEGFLSKEGAIIAYGQALNPSFLKADKEGLNDTWPVYYFWPSYKPRPFSRVIFNLSGPRSAGVVLPMETAPQSFPDGAEVIVIGCQGENGEIDASAVVIQGAAPIQYVSEPLSSRTCPATTP